MLIKRISLTISSLITAVCLSAAPSVSAKTFPGGLPDEIYKELNDFVKAVNLRYDVDKLITPYSEQAVTLCLDALQRDHWAIKNASLLLIKSMVKHWEIPQPILSERIQSAVEQMLHEENLIVVAGAKEVLWFVALKQNDSVKERQAYLSEALDGKNLPDEKSFLKSEAIHFLVEMGDDDAKKILQDKLSVLLNIGDDGKNSEIVLVSQLEVALDEIELHRRLNSLFSPAEQVREIKTFLHRHNQMRIELRSRGTARERSTADYHIILWPFRFLEEIQDPMAVEVLKEIWKDESFDYPHRRFAQSILLRLKVITPEEQTIKEPII